MKNPNDSLQFLAGGGENGALIRAYDWSKTSLGPPESWPKSLKTCVRIILTSRQPMFVWWGKELINIYNDAYQSILGGKHPDALGQPAYIVWRELWDQISPRVNNALHKNEGTYDEALLLIMERNGYPEETYYTFSYSPVPGDDGNPEGIICANTDDTDRIIGERQLRTLKDLGKSYIHSKSDKDVYLSTIQVLRENPQDFPFAMLYKADEQISDFTLMETTGPVNKDIAPANFNIDQKPWPWFIRRAIKADSIEIIKDLSSGALPSGIWPISPFQSIILPIVTKGQAGVFGILVVGVNPYRLLDEKYTGFFELVADQIASGIINVQAYEEEQKRVAALMEIDRAKTVFFNNVSHEFRTPLTLMLGPLEEMVRHNSSLPAPIRENINFTYRNAQRLLKLVNSLLEFSRIEAGRVQASFKPVDLASLTADLASGFRSTIEKAGLKYEVNCSNLSSQVYVDAEMWEKIVLNVLSNAFKYTLEGEIKLTLSQTDSNAVMVVEDTGVGIPKAELPKMFQRFHRVPNTVGRTHEGTGIGLSFIHELVKMHHGEISVESIEGEGSKFTVMVPLGKTHLPASQVSDQYDDAKVSSLAHIFVDEASSLLTGNEGDEFMREREPIKEGLKDSNTHILVVDDNADMRTYLQRLIEPHYSVTLAKNGREALDIIRKNQPHLLVSDVMMPVMSGKELVQAIRKDPNTARLPVILLSARAGEEARIDGFEAGADDYMVKPFSGRELITKIRSQINIAKAHDHADELIRQLFINAPVAICILKGPHFVIELANRHVLDIWGRTADEVLNKPLLDALPEIRGQGFDDLLAGVISTGNRYISNEQKVEIIRDGKMISAYVKFIYEPLYESDGTISGVITLAHEITDLVNARTVAQQNAEQLREQMRRKDEFMSVASHELKTPVTTMKAALQILDRMNVAEPMANNFITKANKQVDRLAVLVSDLLDVTSLQADKMKFYIESFSLSELLNDVVEQLQQSQQGHHIVLEACCDIKIQGDRNRLEQVINNLLSNAIKYSPDSNLVIVNSVCNDGWVRLSVKDFGIGIPQEKLAYVFDRFYRVEESTKNFSGLGLGLYISAEIVRRHGGHIGVERNDTQGSTFWFELPVTNVDEPKDAGTRAGMITQ